MAYRGQTTGRGWNNENSNGGPFEVREPGTRRRKLAGYLKAANELRQTYVQSWNRQDTERQNPDFNDVAIVSTGEERMILFPSYARRHVKQKPEAVPGSVQEIAGTGRDYRDTVGAGDAEFWKEQWETYENDRAIVDVDVRGWVFTPQKGQMSRKQRLMVALARQLVGIPAPSPNVKTSPATSAANSQPTSPSRASSAQADEEYASQQAAVIISKGEAEAEAAVQGAFSERPADSDKDSIYEYEAESSGHPSRTAEGRSERPSQLQLASSNTQPTQMNMSAAELAIANTNLMTRLKPFMANPLTNITINAFFYNDKTSRQKSVCTDAYGHFSFRAALDFVPSHVRVIAREDLSVQEEVKVVESKGVSLISDIDDTIRHSAITRGAREIFRNAFIRDLGELTVQGVKEWYNKLADMGVQIHYVSNSPWQLFPVLTSFFSIAGLPRGSFHLKQYSGMLQGIFEPVAERKKATLERILRDFPDRRFLLIGDSGEADLEVYTDVVMDYPGRILGVFIRDVTMPANRAGGFFDPSMGPLSGGGSSSPRGPYPHSRNHSTDSLSQAKRFSRPADIRDDDKDLEAAIAASLQDMEYETASRRKAVFCESPSPTKMHFGVEERRPPLPQRPSQASVTVSPMSNGSELGDLIDLRDDDATTPKAVQGPFVRQPLTRPAKPAGLSSPNTTPRPAPPRKPVRLRSTSSVSEQAAPSVGGHKIPPPLPRKPSASIRPVSPSPLSQVQDSSPISGHGAKPTTIPDNDRQGVRGYTARKLNAAYGALPSASSYLHGNSSSSSSSSTGQYGHETSVASLGVASRSQHPPPSSSSSSPADIRPYHTNSGGGAVAKGLVKTVPVMLPPPQRRSATTNTPATTAKNGHRGNGSSAAQSAASSTASSTTSRFGGQRYGQQQQQQQQQQRETADEATGQQQQQQQPINKREEMWKRRWRRAKELLDGQGVMLRSWRVGADVMDECVGVVEREVLSEGGRSK